MQAAFKQKYKKALHDRVAGETSGVFRDLLKIVISSASLPAPAPTSEDTARLEALVAPSSRSRTSSVSSVASSVAEEGTGDEASVKSDSEQPSVLEGEGELSNPPSPRSPPSVPYNDEDDTLDFTPQPPSVAQFANLPGSTSPPHTPSLPPSVADSSLNSSTTSTDSAPFVKGHKASSSLSFRQRSSPLEPLGHRPGSSSGGSFDKPHSSLRHSRPAAPGRRRQSHDQVGGRAGLEEPISPGASRSSSPLFARSPTPNGLAEERPRKISGPTSSFSALGSSPPLGRSLSDSVNSYGSSSSSQPSSHQEVGANPLLSPEANHALLQEVTSPISSIDTTSYHATPTSPGTPDASSPTSANALAAYDLATSSPMFSNPYDPDTPDRSYDSSLMRRQASTASTNSLNSLGGGSRLFAGEGVGSFSFSSPSGRPESMMGDQYQNLARHAAE